MRPVKKLRFFKEQIRFLKTRVLLGLAFTIGGVLFYTTLQSWPFITPFQNGLLEIIGLTLSSTQNNSQTLKTWFLSLWPQTKTDTDNHVLLLQNAYLQTQLIYLQNLREENKRLKKALNYKPLLKDWHCVTASVLTNPAQGQTFLIGAGTHHGIQKGHVVVCPQGVVGRIAQASLHFCRVMRLTHRECRIPVKGIKSRVEAIMAGDESPYPVLVYLQENYPLQDSELIVTSLYDGFPVGYPVGQLEPSPKGGVRIKPFIQWPLLEWVQIVIPTPVPTPAS